MRATHSAARGRRSAGDVAGRGRGRRSRRRPAARRPWREGDAGQHRSRARGRAGTGGRRGRRGGGRPSVMPATSSVLEASARVEARRRRCARKRRELAGRRRRRAGRPCRPGKAVDGGPAAARLAGDVVERGLGHAPAGDAAQGGVDRRRSVPGRLPARASSAQRSHAT